MYMSNIWLKRLKPLGLCEHLFIYVSVPKEALGKTELLENKLSEESERSSGPF